MSLDSREGRNQKNFESNVASLSVKNWNNVIKDSNIVAKNDKDLTVETLEVAETLGCNVPIPMLKNRNNANIDLNIIDQNDNQHLCLDIILSRKERPMEYIWTFNSSAKIIPMVPKTLALQTINSFIADLCCVLCRTSSRDNITNKISKKLKFQHERRIDKNGRCLCCKHCRERDCDICVKLFYGFFLKSFLKSDNPWIIVAKLFLKPSESLVSIHGYKSHC